MPLPSRLRYESETATIYDFRQPRDSKGDPGKVGFLVLLLTTLILLLISIAVHHTLMVVERIRELELDQTYDVYWQ